jgi:hypothetical protein
MLFKHRVNEGTVKCTDCHNAHWTFAPTWRTSHFTPISGDESVALDDDGPDAVIVTLVHRVLCGE